MIPYSQYKNYTEKMNKLSNPMGSIKENALGNFTGGAIGGIFGFVVGKALGKNAFMFGLVGVILGRLIITKY